MHTLLRLLQNDRVLRAPRVSWMDIGSIGMNGAMMIIGLLLLFALHN